MDSHTLSGKQDLAKAKVASAKFIHAFLNQQWLPFSVDTKVIVMARFGRESVSMILVWT